MANPLVAEPACRVFPRGSAGGEAKCISIDNRKITLANQRLMEKKKKKINQSSSSGGHLLGLHFDAFLFYVSAAATAVAAAGGLVSHGREVSARCCAVCSGTIWHLACGEQLAFYASGRCLDHKESERKKKRAGTPCPLPGRKSRGGGLGWATMARVVNKSEKNNNNEDELEML